jgi:hypothetical protein
VLTAIVSLTAKPQDSISQQGREVSSEANGDERTEPSRSLDEEEDEGAIGADAEQVAVGQAQTEGNPDSSEAN